MKFTMMLAMLATAATLSLTGCRVEKTKEGDVTVPKYDVDVKKTQEGNVEVPKFDVDTADVDVGTSKVEMKVPTVDVNMPPKSDMTPAPANAATPVPNP